MEVGREKLASWPSEKLAVYAEHSSLFYDVMTDQIVDQVSFCSLRQRDLRAEIG